MFGVCVLQNCFVDARFMDRDVSYRPPRPSRETMQENKNTLSVTVSYTKKYCYRDSSSSTNIVLY